MLPASTRFEQLAAQIQRKNPELTPLKVLALIRADNPSLWADFAEELPKPLPSKPKKAQQQPVKAAPTISAARRFQIGMAEQMQKHAASAHEAFHLVKEADPALYKDYCDQLGYSDETQNSAA